MLKELPFFSEYAGTIHGIAGEDNADNDGGKQREEKAEYSGIFCARLGQAKRIEDFYLLVFQPFLAYLEEKEITEEEMAAKDRYMELRAKMEHINQAISGFLSLLDRCV